MVRFLKDALYMGGVIFWLVVFTIIAVSVALFVIERRQKRGLESDD